MFGFLCSWFKGKCGPNKSAVQKPKHCITWDFLSALVRTAIKSARILWAAITIDRYDSCTEVTVYTNKQDGRKWCSAKNNTANPASLNENVGKIFGVRPHTWGVCPEECLEKPTIRGTIRSTEDVDDLETNSEGKNCLENYLEICLENCLENCLEFPYTRKMWKS